jgi:hypothetical protein
MSKERRIDTLWNDILLNSDPSKEICDGMNSVLDVMGAGTHTQPNSHSHIHTHTRTHTHSLHPPNPISSTLNIIVQLLNYFTHILLHHSLFCGQINLTDIIRADGGVNTKWDTGSWG